MSTSAAQRRKRRRLHARGRKARAETFDTTPDWTRKCEVCDETPIVPATGMCGPCTFGDSSTIGGNW